MSIRFPDEVHKQLVETAERRHISVNSAVVQAAVAWIESEASKISDDEWNAAVKKVIAERTALLGRLDDR